MSHRRLIGLIIVLPLVILGCAPAVALPTPAPTLAATSTSAPVVPTPAPTVTATSAVTETMATVTFVGGKCNYDGPKQIPFGVLAIKWVTDSSGALLVVTLDQGKTIQDLNAWASTEQPPWATVGNVFGTPSGGSDTVKTPVVSKGPIYLVCFGGSRESPTWGGAVGPIEVVPK
jgi:hypothetical protein